MMTVSYTHLDVYKRQGVYTIFGGLHAVMYTEAIQAFVLLIGDVYKRQVFHQSLIVH